MSILLMFKKKKNPAEKVLAIWMAIIVFHLLYAYLSHNQIFSNEFISIFNASVPLLQAPMMYLYFSVLFLGKVNRLKISVHFSPALLSIAYLFIGINNSLITNALSWYVILSVPIYIAWILRSWIVITRKGTSQYHQASNWLKWPLIGLGIIWITFLLLKFLPGLNLDNLHMYFFIAVTGFVYLVAVHLYRTGSSGGSTKPAQLSNAVLTLESALKYSKSGLSDTRAMEIKEILENYMENNKPYLIPEFNLRLLAVNIDVRVNHLSQVINEFEGKSFHDFVNAYRIKEFLAINKSSTKLNYTFLAQALECGFNSKSSFNRAFRKELGMSPSEYLQKA